MTPFVIHSSFSILLAVISSITCLFSTIGSNKILSGDSLLFLLIDWPLLCVALCLEGPLHFFFTVISGFISDSLEIISSSDSDNLHTIIVFEIISF